MSDQAGKGNNHSLQNAPCQDSRTDCTGASRSAPRQPVAQTPGLADRPDAANSDRAPCLRPAGKATAPARAPCLRPAGNTGSTILDAN